MNSSKRKGCRCGNATINPGKLTCCGQRCPCYVESKSCIDCKCRGCRNPHHPNGFKLLPNLSNINPVTNQLQVPVMTTSNSQQSQTQSSNGLQLKLMNQSYIVNTSNLQQQQLHNHHQQQIQIIQPVQQQQQIQIIQSPQQQQNQSSTLVQQRQLQSPSGSGGYLLSQGLVHNQQIHQQQQSQLGTEISINL